MVELRQPYENRFGFAGVLYSESKLDGKNQRPQLQPYSLKCFQVCLASIPAFDEGMKQIMKNTLSTN